MCSRLCHDLITRVGAISTGLEIISENTDEVDSELMALTVNSAHNAVQRLIYYRAAFGFSATGNIDSPAKVELLLGGYLKSRKVNLKFIHGLSNDNQDMVQKYARIILNCVALIVEAAPYGGDLNIDIKTEKGGFMCHIDMKGDLVGLKPENKHALEGRLSDSEITPYNVQGYLTNLLMDKKEVRLTFMENKKKHIALTIENTQNTATLF